MPRVLKPCTDLAPPASHGSSSSTLTHACRPSINEMVRRSIRHVSLGTSSASLVDTCARSWNKNRRQRTGHGTDRRCLIGEWLVDDLAGSHLEAGRSARRPRCGRPPSSSSSPPCRVDDRVYATHAVFECGCWSHVVPAPSVQRAEFVHARQTRTNLAPIRLYL